MRAPPRIIATHDPALGNFNPQCLVQTFPESGTPVAGTVAGTYRLPNDFVTHSTWMRVQQADLVRTFIRMRNWRLKLNFVAQWGNDDGLGRTFARSFSSGTVYSAPFGPAALFPLINENMLPHFIPPSIVVAQFLIGSWMVDGVDEGGVTATITFRIGLDPAIPSKAEIPDEQTTFNGEDLFLRQTGVIAIPVIFNHNQGDEYFVSATYDVTINGSIRLADQNPSFGLRWSNPTYNVTLGYQGDGTGGLYLLQSTSCVSPLGVFPGIVTTYPGSPYQLSVNAFAIEAPPTGGFFANGGIFDGDTGEELP